MQNGEKEREEGGRERVVKKVGCPAKKMGRVAEKVGCVAEKVGDEEAA